MNNGKTFSRADRSRGGTSPDYTFLIISNINRQQFTANLIPTMNEENKPNSPRPVMALLSASMLITAVGIGVDTYSVADEPRPQIREAKPVQYAQARPRKGGKGGRKRGGGTPDGKPKPRISDTLRANIYADNTFTLYINGKLVAVDSIEFIPHNVVSVDILPEYPMTIAVMAKDNAHPQKGTEYVDNIGDGGFILKIGDKIVTSSAWKAKNFFHGPINGDTRNPRVQHTPIPKDWYSVNFDDRNWSHAKEYTEAEIGPKGPYFEHDFKGAKFIWSDNLKLDNTVIFRFQVDGPKATFYTGR